MVGRGGRFIPGRYLFAPAALAAAAAALASAGEAPAIKAPNPPAAVHDALEKGKYPWYDAAADTVKPLWPPREWDLDWLDRWLKPSADGTK